jgi:hypothetical protein
VILIPSLTLTLTPISGFNLRSPEATKDDRDKSHDSLRNVSTDTGGSTGASTGLFNGSAVSAILARRKFLQDDGSDSDQSGDGWD